MRKRFETTSHLAARVLIWASLSALLLWYVRWGSELVSITSYYHIRRSTPFIWSKFHQGLPEIGNKAALDIVYWGCIGVCVIGVLVLLWLALTPCERETAEPDPERPGA